MESATFPTLDLDIDQINNFLSCNVLHTHTNACIHTQLKPQNKPWRTQLGTVIFTATKYLLCLCVSRTEWWCFETYSWIILRVTVTSPKTHRQVCTRSVCVCRPQCPKAGCVSASASTWSAIAGMENSWHRTHTHADTHMQRVSQTRVQLSQILSVTKSQGGGSERSGFWKPRCLVFYSGTI